MEKEPKMLKSPEKVYLLGPLTFQQEQQKINDDIAKARNEFITHLSKTPIEGFPALKWEKLGNKRTEIYEAGCNLAKNVKIHNPEPEKGEIVDSVISVLRVSENLLITGTIEKQAEITNKHQIDNYYKPIEEGLRFNTCGELFIKIDGVSLVDILKGKNLDLSQYLKSVIKATLARNESSHYDEILSENLDPMAKAYPKTGKNTVYNACEQLAYLSLLSPKIYNEIKIPASNNMEREMVQKTKEIIERIFKIKEDLITTILSPYSPDFPTLSETLEKYLNGNDQLLKIIALSKFDFNNTLNEIRSYRRAKTLITDDSFYVKFSAAIKEFAKEFPQQIDILTIDKANHIFNENILKDLPVPTFENIKKINEQILKISKKLEHEADPIDIDSCNSKNVKKIVFKFSSLGDPTKVLVTLHGDGDFEFEIGLNTKKGEIYWYFLEDPRDWEMTDIKDLSMFLIHSSLSKVLLGVKKNAEEEYEKTQALKSLNTELKTPTMPKPEKVRIPREKIKKDKPKPIGVIESTRNENLPITEKVIKANLEFPKGIKIIDLMGAIPKKDMKKILYKIEQLNKFGSNEFGEINAIHEGKKVYRLRVGDYRVLAIQEISGSGNGTGNGKRLFEIFRIGRRNEVYGKNSKII